MKIGVPNDTAEIADGLKSGQILGIIGASIGLAFLAFTTYALVLNIRVNRLQLKNLQAS